MSLKLTIKLAWKNIISNRLRSGLTILGLVIGIASVILLVGLVNGATENVNSEVSSMGADLISVSIYDYDKALTNDELRDLRALDHVSGACPRVYIDAVVSKNGKKPSGVELLGAGENFADMMGYDIANGRDLSRIDVEHYTKCALIGSTIAEKNWKTTNPCGDTLKIDGDDYTVIGVLASSGSSMGYSIDNSVIIPLTTAGYLGQSTDITDFFVRAASEKDTDEVCESVKAWLQTEKGLNSDSCEVSTQKQMLDAMKEINKTLALLLGGIASISLLVGGIGVMNVMLVSVTERTREIGIRKSLGAKRKDILYQFLVESMVLSLAGGLIGVLTGLLFGQVAKLVGGFFAPSLGMILLSVGVSIAVGLLFGILPASRAARLRPVEALRYE